MLDKVGVNLYTDTVSFVMYKGAVRLVMRDVKSPLLKTVNILLALIAAMCTPHILKDDLAAFSLSNSLFSILIFIGYFTLLQYAGKRFEKRMLGLSAVLGFLFSVFMVFGKNIYTTGSVNIIQMKTWVLIFAFFPLFAALVGLCFYYLPTVTTGGRPFERANALSDKKRFFLVWLLIFIAWLPVLLASYPGVYGYDSVYQINFYRSGEFSLQHPIAHSYLLGFFVITVGNLLGSYEAGMCCYSVFQMLCLSAAFSALYSFYISKRWTNGWRIALLLVFMFLPTNPIMAISATKDVLFSAFFALATMLFLMLAEDPTRLRSVKFDVTLTAVLLLVAMFRSQGIYIIVATFVVALILLWKYKKQLLLIFASFVILVGLYNGPISTALGGVPSNSLREMMSIPSVQLARAITCAEGQLTDEESRLIKEYISKYHQYNRDAGIADQFKGSLDTDRLKKDPMEFIGLWAKVGLKCPTAYVDAFARVTVGYWYPDMNYRDPKAYHPYWEYSPTKSSAVVDESKYLLLKQTPVKGFEGLHDRLYDLTYNNSYQSKPLVSMLFSSGLPLWCVLLALGYTLYRKQYRQLIPLGFVMMLVATLLLSPVVLYRYVYPLHLVVPLLVCAGSVKYEKEVD